MEQAIRIFIELIRTEICGTPLNPEIAEEITSEMLEKLYKVAKSQDLTHIVGVSLKKHRLLVDEKSIRKFMKPVHSVLLRYELIHHEQTQIYKVFEKAKIVFVPLKGAVIRDFYPEPWMRTSCDIDILVRKEDLEKAKEHLVSELGYTVGRYKYHDVSLYTPAGVHLELHFHIRENEDKIDQQLAKVWDYVHPVEEGRYQYEMTPEYFMFHATAHMAYHFMNGGIGVRYFIDAWILENKFPYDRKVLNQMYKECEIYQFAESMKLSRVWFDGENHNKITRRVQDYVISGGVFGTLETKVTVRKMQTKGKVKYLKRRIFIPYKEFCASYPKLERLPILYPYYTVKRWFKIFNKHIAKSVAIELKLNRNIVQKDVDDMRKLFKDLKL